MGSLARASLDKVAIVALVLALCLPFSLRNAWAMTLLRSGEEQARSLGIRVERMRLVVLMRVSLLTAAAMCFVGEIGFIGLVRSEEHTSELQSRPHLVCRLLLEK